MFLRDDKLVNVLLSFDFLLLQFLGDFLVDRAHPGLGLFVQDAQLGVQIQVFDIGSIENCFVSQIRMNIKSYQEREI